MLCRVSNREAGQYWTQFTVMKLRRLEFVTYTMQNFLHLISRTIAVASSVDKVGVIASEPVAYAFIEMVDLSLDISTTRSKRNNDNK
jgi:hypothetical protein